MPRNFTLKCENHFWSEHVRYGKECFISKTFKRFFLLRGSWKSISYFFFNLKVLIWRKILKLYHCFKERYTRCPRCNFLARYFQFCGIIKVNQISDLSGHEFITVKIVLIFLLFKLTSKRQSFGGKKKISWDGFS